jgi:hypothetical protein
MLYGLIAPQSPPWRIAKLRADNCLAGGKKYSDFALLARTFARHTALGAHLSIFRSADILVRPFVKVHPEADKNVRAPNRQLFECRKEVRCAKAG